MTKEEKQLTRELNQLFGFPVCAVPGCHRGVDYEVLGKDLCKYHASVRSVQRLLKKGFLKFNHNK